VDAKREPGNTTAIEITHHGDLSEMQLYAPGMGLTTEVAAP
jgi:hypothetical protein